MDFKNPFEAHRNVGIPLVGVTYSDQTFQGDDLTLVTFSKCVFTRVRLEQVTFHQTMFIECQFDDCVLHDCQMSYAQWVKCTGSGLEISGGAINDLLFSEDKFDQLVFGQSSHQTVFNDTTVKRVAFNGAGCSQDQILMSNCDFAEVLAENADWKNASIVEIDLNTWSLDNAKMEACNFIQAKASGFDFSSVRLKKCNLYKSDLQKAKIRWAEESIFAECNLEEVDCVGAHLKGVLCSKASAPHGRFDQANLEGALFAKAILTGASFAGAEATHSVWSDADLTDANLEGINAYRGCFRNTILDGANVTNARLVEADLHGVTATLEDADIRDARGTVEWRAEIEKKAKEPVPDDVDAGEAKV